MLKYLYVLTNVKILPLFIYVSLTEFKVNVYCGKRMIWQKAPLLSQLWQGKPQEAGF